MQSCKGTIVYLGGFELPDKNAAAHRVINNAKIFSALGYKVVFCGINKDLDWNNGLHREDVHGFDSYPIAYPKTNRQWIARLLFVSQYIQLLNKTEDVKFIIGYNLHALPLKKILRYAKKHRIKVIVDCTEWYDNTFSLNPIKLVKFIDTNLSMRIYQKKADGLIAISQFLNNYYATTIKNRIIVPPLIDVKSSIWENTNNDCEENAVDKFKFIYAGSPGGTKDKLDQIIRCFCQLGDKFDYLFTIVGITEKEYLKIYKSQGDELQQLGKRILFKGRVSHKDSITALKNSDCCIFVRDRSRKNMAGFPTKFVECYTSGVCIIANEVSDIKSYFPNDGQSILVRDCTDECIIFAQKQVLQKELITLRRERRNGILNNAFDYTKWENVFKEFFNSLERS